MLRYQNGKTSMYVDIKSKYGLIDLGIAMNHFEVGEPAVKRKALHYIATSRIKKL